MRSRYWVVVPLVFGVFASACEARLDVGATCTYDSECASPLSCRLGRCRAQCLTTRDCGAGSECWLSEGVGVCRVPDEASCAGSCFGGLLCVTGACRAPCIDETDCVADSQCTMLGTERICVPNEMAPDAGAIDAGTDAGLRDAGQDARGCSAGSCEYGPCIDRTCDEAVAVMLSIGNTCILRGSGALDCTGDNRDWLLGSTTPDRRASYAPIAGLPPVVEADIGWSLGCARTSAGAAWCWGVLPAAIVATPTAIVTDPLSEISTGTLFACGLSATQVLCWGVDTRGELGDATLHPACSLGDHCSATPVVVAGIDGARVRDLDAGYEHACVVLDDGSAYCWGSDGDRRLGLGGPAAETCLPGEGDVPCSQTPQRVVTTERFMRVACGFYHTCALTESGRVACWGGNSEGQLGLGNRDETATATLVPGLSNIEHIAAGAASTCAIERGGALWCWGSGGDGQLLGASVATAPLRLMASGVVDVALGGGHICVRTDAGQVLCWGSDVHGQIGDGEITPIESAPVPVRVTGLDR